MDKNKVLVIDDDPSIRELISVNLRAGGYSVETAKNGREALEKVKINTPDLLILDIMMPEIDGWEVCKILRDEPEYRGMKILFLSAKGAERDKMIGKEILNADEYMTKPFDTDELTDTVGRLLHG